MGSLAGGALNYPTGSDPKARVNYRAMWPDGIGRQTAAANYGTNANTPITRPSTAPASSISVLVSLVAYNIRGGGQKWDRSEFGKMGGLVSLPFPPISDLSRMASRHRAQRVEHARRRRAAPNHRHDLRQPRAARASSWSGPSRRHVDGPHRHVDPLSRSRQASLDGPGAEKVTATKFG